ncbi:GNAT family N-acetyltransferase [Streptomyces sp. NPDC016626]|uniref:GNAT family N-acetyltransferase n=1 Tax=Streptomyces sp. NPDC016626 TaxID=3364968 RepID=UPI0037035F59
MNGEIFRDPWGIPHLRADDANALARVQGRVTALDRAWQLEVERHRAQGTSAAFLGPDALPWDRFVRRARLADTARRCFAALERRDPETARWVRAYVDGVNEGLASAGEAVARQPSADPAPRSGAPAGHAAGPAENRPAVPAYGPAGAAPPAPGAAGAATRADGPGDPAGPTNPTGPTGPTGPAVSAGFPDPADSDTGGAAAPAVDTAPEFVRAGLAPGRWEPWTPLAVWLATHILFAGFPAKLWREHVSTHLGADAVALFATDGPGTAGSNGWLVTGERTVTGHAIIAGDPHRFIEDPGVYQQIRLSCPEFDVVGLAVPGVPGIAHFGHTGTVAWAITNAMADYQDLYRERLRRTGAGVEALGPDGVWRRAARHTETIEVAGEEPVEVEVIETDRGPVVIGGPEGLDDGVPEPGEPPVAIALRHPPRVTGDLGFGALLPLLRARRAADVDAAVERWAEPVNVVLAADTEGGTLHRVAGRVPARSTANRTRLVPAWEPGHEWRGWHEPPRAGLTDGIAVMANQRGPATPLGVEFAPPHRADRIAALLTVRHSWSATDMSAVHTDTHLASAAALLDHLAALDGLSAPAAALRDRLLRWNRHMDADSADAAAYAAVRGAVVRRLAAHPAFAALRTPPAYPAVFLPWLALVPRVGFALEHLLRAPRLYGVDRPAEVRAALEEVAARPPAGTWGDTHRLAPWRALPPATPYDEPGLSGDHDCVLCTSPVPGLTDLAARGPAARYVWDLARREDSRWVVPLGASGVPGSPHHRDQQPLWAAGDLAPVVTDWDRLHRQADAPRRTTAARRPAPEPTTGTGGDRPAPGPTQRPAPGTDGGRPAPETGEPPRRGTRERPTRRAMSDPYAARTAVHEQHVDGFGSVRVLPLDPTADAPLLHHWVSGERAAFWGMNGLTEPQVAEIYAHLDTLDTHHAYLVLKDGEPAALFQTYEPAADRVGECYPVEPGDIGVHLLLAPAGPDGARSGWTRGLLAALTSFVLLGLDRRRVVVDPDVANEKAIARFLRQGFTAGPAVDLPEVDLPDVYLPQKKAQLAFLTRDVAFGG